MITLEEGTPIHTFEKNLSLAEKSAIDFLRRNEPEEGYLLHFSGGKDSCVINRVAEKAGVKFQSLYAAVGIDPPEVIDFVKKEYPDVEWGYPKRHFFSFLLQYGYPTKTYRWCTTSLKMYPFRRTKYKQKCRILGVRAAESTKRAKYVERISPGSQHPYARGQLIFKPIFWWPDWMVWEYIKKEKIKTCSLYKEGYERLGCMVCPQMCGKDRRKIDVNKQRWPEFYSLFEKTMFVLFSTHKTLGNVRKVFSFDEFLDTWYRGGKILNNEDVMALKEEE